jgi:nucleoside-diphosphate-sugar epimerase
MATLVCGGAGFVGSHLCDRLLRDRHQVICLDNLSTGRLANVGHLLDRPDFTFVEHDLLDPLPAIPPVQHIYHLASPASPPAYQSQPVATMRVNSEGTYRLLELARQHRARFLFASTSEVYGDPLVHPQREDYRGNVSSTGPRSMYDEAKRYGEALTTACGQQWNLDTRIVRIFNTYGPRLDPKDGRVVSNFVVQALRNQPLTVYGDGSQTRSFQYVDDLVEGLVRAIGSSYAGPVNLGNPQEYTVLDLAGLVQDLVGTRNAIDFHPLPGDDPKQRRPDIALASSALGWKPRVSVIEGLRQTIEHFRLEMVNAGTHQPTRIDVPAAAAYITAAGQ